MKRITAAVMIWCLVICASPGYAFIDYLFGGSSNRGAIDNSAIGEMRSWWTGNPVYQFNPYYSGSGANPAAQGQQGMQQQPAAPQAPQPNVSFYPPQGAPAPVAQQYGQPAQAPYTAPQQQYAPPQQYAAPQQGYQPQSYQQPPAQGYAPQQAYQAPQGYQPPPPQQQYYNGENGMYGGAGFVPGQPQR